MVTRPLGGGATTLGVREAAQALGRPPLNLLKPLQPLPRPRLLPLKEGEGGEALQHLFATSEDD